MEIFSWRHCVWYKKKFKCFIFLLTTRQFDRHESQTQAGTFTFNPHWFNCWLRYGNVTPQKMFSICCMLCHNRFPANFSIEFMFVLHSDIISWKICIYFILMMIFFRVCKTLSSNWLFMVLVKHTIYLTKILFFFLMYTLRSYVTDICIYLFF
jgi:hypothetical protein